MEAAIYFPIVFLVIMFLICVGLAKLQGAILYYDVERTASEAAKSITYIGYENLLDDGLSFAADMKELPTKEQISAYYEEKPNDLYHFKINYAKENQIYSDKLKKMVRSLYFIAGGLIKPEVKIKGGLIPRAEVKVTYEFSFPSMFGYLTGKQGAFDKISVAGYSRSVAMNQTEFVRNMDIISDILEYLADKLGISDDISRVMEKMKSMKDKFL